MEITYDKQADAMHFYLQKGRKVARTVELTDLLMADLDKKGKVIGVEIIGVSKQVGSRKKNNAKKEFFNFSVPLPA